MKGGNKFINCTPPHDIPEKPFKPNMIKPERPEAKDTAEH